jgi:hypothetical protein
MGEDEIKGIDLTLPYDWNAIGACVPICKTGYWRNGNNDFGQLWLANNGKCSYDNCKDWSREDSNLDFRKCGKCWGMDDLKNWDTWVGKGSMPIQLFNSGVEKGDPYTLNDDLQSCVLNCKTGFWSNWDSNHDSTSDPNAQRCTHNNCKAWDSLADEPLNPSIGP